METKAIRTFFSLKLNHRSIAQIESGLSELKRLIPDHVKWVSADAIHITLKFIGTFDPMHIPIVENRLKTDLSEFGNINLLFSGLGIFPDMNNPRIIWMGINDYKKISNLASVIDETLWNSGYDREKRTFSPHLTIGRLRNYVGREDSSRISEIINHFNFPLIDPTLVDKIHFIKSKLTPQGPIYTTLFEIDL